MKYPVKLDLYERDLNCLLKATEAVREKIIYSDSISVEDYSFLKRIDELETWFEEILKS